MFRRKQSEQHSASECFVCALNSLNQWTPSNADDKIRYYNFIIENLKVAITAEAQLDFLLNPHIHDNSKCYVFFPLYYYNSTYGCETIERDEKRILDLKNDTVVASASKSNSLVNHLKARLDDPFVQNCSHLAKYFTYIDLAIVYNGIHSTSSAMFYKNGIITAKECDFTKLFASTVTDGSVWWSTTAEKNMGLVRDYRYALLFEIAKRKYLLEK